MTNRKQSLTSLGMMFAASIAAGCASTAPPELVNARAAYARASAGSAAQLAPAEVHKARESLDLAERSFGQSPDSARTKDLAYVAERKAQLAEALAGETAENQRKAQAESDYQATQSKIAQMTKSELDASRAQLADAQKRGQMTADQLAQYQKQAAEANQRAADADKRAKEAQDALAKLAAVKEEERGTVITLSGSVLFPSDQATLLPEAQTRLGQVSDALLATKERNITVEGHTDARGSESHNLDLSQRRAEAVRAFLVQRGYEPDKIQARGIGKARPVADNNSAEGRANNRRVEIVVQPKAK